MWIFKPIPLIALNTYYIISLGSRITKFDVFIIIAFIGSVLGDIFLINSDNTNFIRGLVSFAIGHLFFIIAYLQNILTNLVPK